MVPVSTKNWHFILESSNIENFGGILSLSHFILETQRDSDVRAENLRLPKGTFLAASQVRSCRIVVAWTVLYWNFYHIKGDVTDVLISSWKQFMNLKVNGHQIAVYRNRGSCIKIWIIFLVHDSDVSKISAICIKIFWYTDSFVTRVFMYRKNDTYCIVYQKISRLFDTRCNMYKKTGTRTCTRS